MWRGNLKSLLPPPAKVHAIAHRAALAWRGAPALMAALGAAPDMVSSCLAFLILTAVRSGEARGARWSEIDMEQRLWIIPGNRMKTGKEHRVPLSDAAMAILGELDEVRMAEPLVFLGHVRGRRLDDTVLTKVLRRMGHEVTVHGMRSTFRDFCAEATNFPREVAELALAHVVGSAVERAYARSDLLDRRRQLMDQWADYLTKPPAVVVPLRRA